MRTIPFTIRRWKGFHATIELKNCAYFLFPNLVSTACALILSSDFNLELTSSRFFTNRSSFKVPLSLKETSPEGCPRMFPFVLTSKI